MPTRFSSFEVATRDFKSDDPTMMTSDRPLRGPIPWEIHITEFTTHFNRYYLFPSGRLLPLGVLPPAQARDGFRLGCRFAKGHHGPLPPYGADPSRTCIGWLKASIPSQ